MKNRPQEDGDGDKAIACACKSGENHALAALCGLLKIHRHTP